MVAILGRINSNKDVFNRHSKTFMVNTLRVAPETVLKNAKKSLSYLYVLLLKSSYKEVFCFSAALSAISLRPHPIPHQQENYGPIFFPFLFTMLKTFWDFFETNACEDTFILFLRGSVKSSEKNFMTNYFLLNCMKWIPFEVVWGRMGQQSENSH